MQDPGIVWVVYSTNTSGGPGGRRQKKARDDDGTRPAASGGLSPSRDPSERPGEAPPGHTPPTHLPCPLNAETRAHSIGCQGPARPEAPVPALLARAAPAFRAGHTSRCNFDSLCTSQTGEDRASVWQLHHPNLTHKKIKLRSFHTSSSYTRALLECGDWSFFLLTNMT